jgi:hypothetical protein
MPSTQFVTHNGIPRQENHSFGTFFRHGVKPGIEIDEKGQKNYVSRRAGLTNLSRVPVHTSTD